MNKVKNIVVIGGGTGVYTVLSGLKKHPHNLSAIVSMADDGGSTGALREDFGILPPGDIRRALVALSDSEESLSSLFNYRFNEGLFNGHNFGNLFIAALERITGDFEQAIEEASRLLRVRGSVIPVTLDNSRLFAELENGDVIEGETNIDIPKHDPTLRIKHVYLEPLARANKRALKAVREAHLIVIGPGDLYTSIIPNLLVHGIASTIKKSSARKVYVCNIMTKLGETNGFGAADFMREIERYLGKGVIDTVLVNKRPPRRSRLLYYLYHDGSEPVKNNFEKMEKLYNVVETDLLREGGLVRHDPDKLATAMLRSSRFL